MNKKIFIVGPCGGGDTPQNGASAKNYHLAKYLQRKGLPIEILDTENWRKSPIVLIKILLSFLFYPNNKFIIAVDNMSGYKLMHILSKLRLKRAIIYWIIGGSIADWIKTGKVKAEPYQIVEWFIVEGEKMKKTLYECGFNNVLCVSNFKNIDYIPSPKENTSSITRFVFLSRIIPEKGCNLIFEAASLLRSKYQDIFSIDFYGPIQQEYNDEFTLKVAQFDNVSYKGFLDLNKSFNYDILSTYDVMLFPTYWHGEGFPGSIIDAFVAGLPVIASDWSMNAEIIRNRETGLIIRPQSASELAEKMHTLIRDRRLLEQMANKCLAKADTYRINNVITDNLLITLGLL